MPTEFRINHRIDQAQNRILIKVRGRYKSADLIDALISLYQTMDKPWTYDRVMDMRSADGFVDFPDLLRIAKIWADMAGTPLPQRMRLALISQDPFDGPRLTGMTDLFPKEYIQTFSTMDEALDWLPSARADQNGLTPSLV